MELIGRAGGLSPGTIQDPLFEDYTLPTAMRVVIRNEGDKYRSYQKEMSAFYRLTLGIPISLNRESEEGLTAIPGIGPRFARAIVIERSKRGGFKDMDEILSIDGISHGLYRKIRPLITLY